MQRGRRGPQQEGPAAWEAARPPLVPEPSPASSPMGGAGVCLPVGQGRGEGCARGWTARGGPGLAGSAGRREPACFLAGLLGEDPSLRADGLIMSGVWISGFSQAGVPSPRGGAGHEGLGS